MKRTPIKPRRGKARRGPLRDSKYLAWIREQPCAICQRESMEQTTMTEAAHVGDRGLGQKCSDRETLPLCAVHHRTGSAAHHVLGKRFWTHHGIDKPETIRKYQGKRHMGSSIDDFLKEEGILEEAQTQAVKELVEWQRK